MSAYIFIALFHGDKIAFLWNVTPCSDVKMESAWSFETLLSYHITGQHYNTQYRDLKSFDVCFRLSSLFYLPCLPCVALIDVICRRGYSRRLQTPAIDFTLLYVARHQTGTCSQCHYHAYRCIEICTVMCIPKTADASGRRY